MVDFSISPAGGVGVNGECSKTPLDVAREKGQKEIVAYLAIKMADAFHEKGKYDKPGRLIRKRLVFKKSF